MIVLDASVAVLGLLGDGEARRTLASEDIAVPHVIDLEVANTLRRQARRGLIDRDPATAALETWRALAVRRYAMVGLLPRIWTLRDNVSVYDAAYVALAEAVGCHLVTADARLATAPGVRCEVTLIGT